MLVLVACSKEEGKTNPEESTNGKVQLTVKATNAPTKVVFGDKVGSTYPATWSAEGEAVKLIELITPTGEDMRLADYTSQNDYTLNSDKTVATFGFTLKESTDAGTYDYYSVYPESAYSSTNTTNKYIYFKIPEVQTPLANSPDPAAIVYYASATGFTAQQTALTLNYNHPLVSFGRITLLNAATAIGAGETIESVTINVPCGGYHYLWESNTIESYDATHKESITIKTDNLTTTGASFDVWFACGNFGGFKAAESDVLKVSIKTDKETYVRKITVMSDISFNGGKVSHFSVDMATAAPEDFSGTYIIASAKSDGTSKVFLMYKDLGGTGTNTYYKHTATDVDAATANLTDASVSFPSYCTSDYAWIVTKVTGGYSIKNATTGKYIDWSSGNYAKAVDDPAVLSISEDGIFTVVKYGTEPTRQLQYNSGSPRFAFYTSSQWPLVFIPVSIKTPLDAPTSVTASVTGSTINVSWTDTPSGVDHYVVGCTGQTPKNINQGVQAASFTGLAEGDYEVTIYAVPTDPATYANSATVTVSELHVGSALVYNKATSITSGKSYLIVAVATAAPSGKEANIGTWAGQPVAAGKNYDYLQKQAVTITADQITMTSAACEFVFTEGTGENAGKYTIKQSDNRYLYMSGTYNNFNVNASPTEGQYWTVTITSDGATITNVAKNKYIQFSSNYGSFGSYADAQTNGYMPMLFEKQ